MLWMFVFHKRPGEQWEGWGSRAAAMIMMMQLIGPTARGKAVVLWTDLKIMSKIRWIENATRPGIKTITKGDGVTRPKILYPQTIS